MKLTELTDPAITWATMTKYFAQTPRREGSHIISTFIQESEPFKKEYTWLAFYLWCFVRTEAFTAKCWIDNWDAGKLGGQYQVSREGIRAAAQEFAKFSDTNMLDEEAEILKEFEAIKSFSHGANPENKDPITEPPKPIPLPPAPVDPTPQPSEPETSGKPTWRANLKWIGTIAGVLLAAWFLIGSFVPAGISNLVQLVLTALRDFF